MPPKFLSRGRQCPPKNNPSASPAQGSVLGPVLFLIFINDLDVDVVSRLLKFADDTKLFGRADSAANRELLQKDLDRLGGWSMTWQMSFNVDKCRVMHMGSRNTRHIYRPEGRELGAVSEEKDLGVTISSDLKCSRQCREAYNKAVRVLGMINRTIQFKNKRILVCLYKSLVRPLLEYSIPAWSPHYVKDKFLLERVQHRFTRMIKGMRPLVYEERQSVLNLWTLEERRNRADLIEITFSMD